MVICRGGVTVELVKITHENLEMEHICCAIANNKDSQVMSKKFWLKERLDEGLVILSSKKKMGFLSDLKYMKYKGFETVDSANSYFELMYLPFSNDAEKPQFKQHLKEIKHNDLQNGFTLYYTSQCPFTAKYVPLLEKIAKKRSVDFQVVHILTREQAQNVPAPFTTFSLFYNGEFATHEILSEKKFEKILASKVL